MRIILVVNLIYHNYALLIGMKFIELFYFIKYIIFIDDVGIKLKENRVLHGLLCNVNIGKFDRKKLLHVNGFWHSMSK